MMELDKVFVEARYAPFFYFPTYSLKKNKIGIV